MIRHYVFLIICRASSVRSTHFNTYRRAHFIFSISCNLFTYTSSSCDTRLNKKPVKIELSISFNLSTKKVVGAVRSPTVQTSIQLKTRRKTPATLKMFPRKLDHKDEIHGAGPNSEYVSHYEISDCGYGKDNVKILHLERIGGVHNIKEMEVSTHLKLYSKKDYLNGKHWLFV